RGRSTERSAHHVGITLEHRRAPLFVPTLLCSAQPIGEARVRDYRIALIVEGGTALQRGLGLLGRSDQASLDPGEDRGALGHALRGLQLGHRVAVTEWLDDVD